MSRLSLIVVLVAAGILSGCGWTQKFEGRVAPDAVSLADRCAGIMKAAMPFAEIDVGERSSKDLDIRTIVAVVAGNRTDLPKDSPGEPDLAVECTFVDNLLTGFRWTRGGPAPADH